MSKPTQRSLLVLCSYHHRNTEKVAQAIGKVLHAEIISPKEVRIRELQMYDLVGFGSGIYDGKHHKSILDLAGRLPNVECKKVFLFSTCGIPAFAMTQEVAEGNHKQLRDLLVSKGYEVVGEFGCVGWNTNSFLKLFGGLNKGRPGPQDLEDATGFAKSLLEHMEDKKKKGPGGGSGPKIRPVGRI